MKISNWPQAMVIAVGLVVTGTLIAFLVSAGWSAEGIGAFATLAIGLFTSQVIQTHRSSTVEAKTDQQTDTLNTLVEQTNGRSDAELDEIADRAAVRVVAAYKRGELK